MHSKLKYDVEQVLTYWLCFVMYFFNALSRYLRTKWSLRKWFLAAPLTAAFVFLNLLFWQLWLCCIFPSKLIHESVLWKIKLQIRLNTCKISEAQKRPVRWKEIGSLKRNYQNQSDIQSTTIMSTIFPRQNTKFLFRRVFFLSGQFQLKQDYHFSIYTWHPALIIRKIIYLTD